jgi:hypothetical protein
MPNITINIPAAIAQDVTAIMQKKAGNDEPSSLTGRALLSAYLQHQLGPELRARYIKRGASLVAEEAARTAAEAALAAEVKARDTAIADATADAIAGIQGIA